MSPSAQNIQRRIRIASRDKGKVALAKGHNSASMNDGSGFPK